MEYTQIIANDDKNTQTLLLQDGTRLTLDIIIAGDFVFIKYKDYPLTRATICDNLFPLQKDEYRIGIVHSEGMSVELYPANLSEFEFEVERK